MRQAITAHSRDRKWLLRGEIKTDETYLEGRRKDKRGRGAHNKVPVFGILERKGRSKVDVLRDVTAEPIQTLTVKTVRRGSTVYAHKYRDNDALMFRGYQHLRIDHGKRFSRGKVYINGLEGFWICPKEKLFKVHGVSNVKFPFCLKEMEFRYNYRHQSILQFKYLFGHSIVHRSKGTVEFSLSSG